MSKIIENTHRHTHYSLKNIVLISARCHRLCTFQWERRNKDFKEKRSEEFSILQELQIQHVQNWFTLLPLLELLLLSVFLISINVITIYPTCLRLKHGSQPRLLSVSPVSFNRLSRATNFTSTYFLESIPSSCLVLLPGQLKNSSLHHQVCRNGLSVTHLASTLQPSNLHQDQFLLSFCLKSLSRD